MKNLVFSLINKIGRTLRGRGLGLENLTLLRRAYETIYHRVAPKETILVTVQNNQMYVNPQDEPLGRSLASQGVYEAYETKLFRSIVKEGMTVVDIGANVGYYTLIAAELVGESGKVFAFEPESGNYELLKRNVALNGYLNVETVDRAVSNRTGTVKLYIDKRNYGNRSLAKKNIVVEGGAVDAHTVSLDEFCETHLEGRQIDVLKIDAQGAEGLILEGAQNTLKNQVPKLFMEFEPEMLRNLGTDPLDLIRDFFDIGYDFKLLDYGTQTLRKIAPSHLLKECSKNGYVDLYLEKRSVRD